MAFLHRLAESFKEGLVTLTNGGEAPRRAEAQARSLSKQSSKGRSRSSSVSFGFLESHIRDAIAAFVQDKFEKGEAKPHVFTQFWLQLPKLEAGFKVLRRQLEARTGCREGPLPLAVLQSNPQDFGIEEGSMVVQELCSKAATQKCTDIDFIGLVMLLLLIHLTEGPSAGASAPDAASESAAPIAPIPAVAAPAPVLLHPEFRTMLSCLELAFTHFNSARRGKLDKREVAEALQYESAKAHTKEGTRGRTSNRLAHRLFEGLDWEHDNTISFEDFLRGILQLVYDEFGEVPEDDPETEAGTETEEGDEEDAEEEGVEAGREGQEERPQPPARARVNCGSGSPAPSPQGEATATAAAATRAGASGGPRRCGSSRTDSASRREGSYSRSQNRPRSNSAMGMTSSGGAGRNAAGLGLGSVQGQGQGQESAGLSPGGFLAALKGTLRRSLDTAAAAVPAPATATAM